MGGRFIKRDAEGNVLIDKICEPLPAISYRMRRAYVRIAYVGRIIAKTRGLTPGASYYALSDGRLSRRPPETGTVALMGVALDSTRIMLSAPHMIWDIIAGGYRMHEGGDVDVSGLVEAP